MNKYCKNCKFFLVKEIDCWYWTEEEYICTHPELRIRETSPVLGPSISFPTAEQALETCNHELWEKYIPPEPKIKKITDSTTNTGGYITIFIFLTIIAFLIIK